MTDRNRPSRAPRLMAAGGLAVTLALAAGACTHKPPHGGPRPTTTTTTAPAAQDVVDTAVAAGQFTTLASLLQKAGLVETLKGPGPFTVFAPTDAAFAKVPAATLEGLGNDPAKLRQVLTYHVVAGKFLSTDLTSGPVATVAGPTVNVQVGGGMVMVNGAMVTKADVVASNGVIHVIDSVLLPPA
jgi:uncharacterized surface protein with fasciclin (FAS1) repeats